MPFIIDPKARRAADEFKDFLHELAENTRTKQESIGRNLGLSQSTVHNYFDKESERHMPAALLPLLPSPMNTEAIKHLARKMELRVNVQLNGRIDDEVMDLTEKSGEFVHKFRTSPNKKIEIIAIGNEMLEIIKRAIAEVEAA